MKHYAYQSPFKMKDLEGNEYLLTVEIDEYSDDPRNWDNLCTMVCFRNRYKLGDKHNYDSCWDFLESLCKQLLDMKYEDCEDMSENELFEKLVNSDKVIIKTIRLYDHSGITVSTSNGYPYTDRWDSCCVGYIYVTKEKILKEIANANETNWSVIADEIMENEMEQYDQYLRGDVYWFRLTKKVMAQDLCPHCGEVIREYEDEEEIDNCAGFYGYCLEENGILDNISKDIKFVEE